MASLRLGRSGGGLVGLFAAVLVLVGCTVPRPPGDGALRYRDQVFGSANMTRDLTYGRAPDAQGNAGRSEARPLPACGDTLAKRPALIWVHGGGFTTGDKRAVAGRAGLLHQAGLRGGCHQLPAAVAHRLWRQPRPDSGLRKRPRSGPSTTLRPRCDGFGRRPPLSGSTLVALPSAAAPQVPSRPCSSTGVPRMPARAAIRGSPPTSGRPCLSRVARQPRSSSTERFASDLLPRHRGPNRALHLGGTECGRNVQRGDLHRARAVRGRGPLNR